MWRAVAEGSRTHVTLKQNEGFWGSEGISRRWQGDTGSQEKGRLTKTKYV